MLKFLLALSIICSDKDTISSKLLEFIKINNKEPIKWSFCPFTNIPTNKSLPISNYLYELKNVGKVLSINEEGKIYVSIKFETDTKIYYEIMVFKVQFSDSSFIWTRQNDYLFINKDI